MPSWYRSADSGGWANTGVLKAGATPCGSIGVEMSILPLFALLAVRDAPPSRLHVGGGPGGGRGTIPPGAAEKVVMAVPAANVAAGAGAAMGGAAGENALAPA